MHASHSVAGQFGTSNGLFASIPIIWITFILPNKSFYPLTLLVLLILSSYLKLEKYWAFPLIWFTLHNLLCLRMKALNCTPCSLGFPCLQPTRLSIPFSFLLHTSILPLSLFHGVSKYIHISPLLFSWVFWLLWLSLQRGPQPYYRSPPVFKGNTFQYPNGCLKPRIVLSLIYTMFLCVCF